MDGGRFEKNRNCPKVPTKARNTYWHPATRPQQPTAPHNTPQSALKCPKVPTTPNNRTAEASSLRHMQHSLVDPKGKFIFSTVHKFKGLECRTVGLLDDFNY
jgi:hypothetical protein